MTAPNPRRTELTFDTAVYRLTAVKKAAYKFSGRCLVAIQLMGERAAQVVIECSDPSADLSQLAQEFHCEVTDQELREVVMDETAGIRNLLLAQAFSATSLAEPDEHSADYRLDPKGIGLPDD